MKCPQCGEIITSDTLLIKLAEGPLTGVCPWCGYEWVVE